MAVKTQYAALNRHSRGLNVRVRKLLEETKAGMKNPEEAARLRRAFAEIRPDIKQAKELNHSRIQALTAHALTVEGAVLRDMFAKMNKTELRSAIAPLLDRANKGEKQALTALGALAGVISNMPAEDRPTTLTKLAALTPLPDYDAAAAEIHEANFFLEMAERVLPRLEAGQVPSTQDLMALGAMRRELDGGGWRDFATLADANNELRSTPKPDKEPDAPADLSEHADPENPDGQVGDNANPPASDAAPGTEVDNPSGENQPGSESKEGAQ